MKKRISARGIIVEEDCFYALFRRKINENGYIKEYYAIPGGGIEENEKLEDAVKRELKEEFSVDVEIIDFLGMDKSDNGIANFYCCKIVGGNLELGGEELDRCCESNYYEIKKIGIHDLDKIDISSKEMISKAFEVTHNKN